MPPGQRCCVGESAVIAPTPPQWNCVCWSAFPKRFANFGNESNESNESKREQNESKREQREQTAAGRSNAGNPARRPEARTTVAATVSPAFAPRGLFPVRPFTPRPHRPRIRFCLRRKVTPSAGRKPPLMTPPSSPSSAPISPPRPSPAKATARSTPAFTSSPGTRSDGNRRGGGGEERGLAGGRAVLRLMRAHRRLSPHRSAFAPAKAHDGRITTDAPKVRWATDGAKIWTVEDGWVWLFAPLRQAQGRVAPRRRRHLHPTIPPPLAPRKIPLPISHGSPSCLPVHHALGCLNLPVRCPIDRVRYTWCRVLDGSGGWRCRSLGEDSGRGVSRTWLGL